VDDSLRALLMLQESREEAALAEGYKAFVASVQKQKASDLYSSTPAALGLVSTGISAVHGRIVEWLQEQGEVDRRESRKGRSRDKRRKQQLKHFAAKWFNAIGPDVVAYMGLKVVLDTILKRAKYAVVCLKIAERIIDELRYRKLKEQVPELLEWKLAQFATNDYDHMQRSLDHTVRTMLDPNDVAGWDLTVQRRHQLGALVVDFIYPSGLFEFEQEKSEKGMHTEKIIVATEETEKWLLDKNEWFGLRQEQNVPMVVPPKDWEFGKRGGYLFALRGKYPLVRGMFWAKRDEPEQTDMPLIYATLNALQRTPWTINRAVYSALEARYDEDLKNKPEPLVMPAHLQERPKGDEERGRWISKAAKRHNEIFKWRQEMRKMRRVLDTAKALLGIDKFYFPYSLDFRGRIYPLADYMHPQGDDYSRGLLMLADGKEVNSGNQGDAWLGVHGANCFGEDSGRKMSRMSFAERVSWVDANEANIVAAANDPSGTQWWKEADDPVQFLAFCFEWRSLLEADRSGQPFTSRIPVYLDGTCNGLQHFSAAFRDEVGGQAVNLTPGQQPQDIYQKVADRVLTALESETDSVASAILGLGLVTRKLAKRPTMTFCYGSKQYGFKRQLRDYLRKLDNWEQIKATLVNADGKSDVGTACALLARLLWEALGDIVVKAAEGMQWMQDCAQQIAVGTQTVRWVVPVTGLPVKQAYISLKTRTINTILMGSLVQANLHEPKEPEQINKRKEANAISPNVVHSLDAAALVLAVTNGIGLGIRSFAMVHDSYGTLAADVREMRKATREAFVALYSQPVIENLYEQWQQQTSEELPHPPEQGSLNLKDVLRSEYFFA